jgi:hypothetical protein
LFLKLLEIDSPKRWVYAAYLATLTIGCINFLLFRPHDCGPRSRFNLVACRSRAIQALVVLPDSSGRSAPVLGFVAYTQKAQVSWLPRVTDDPIGKLFVVPYFRHETLIATIYWLLVVFAIIAGWRQYRHIAIVGITTVLVPSRAHHGIFVCAKVNL